MPRNWPAKDERGPRRRRGRQTTAIPSIGTLDSTFALLKDGYEFMQARRERVAGDSFRCRLMLREALCISGDDAARLFYSAGRFTCRGAMPPTALRLLQGPGSVQTLDGEAHAARKQLFLSLTALDAVERLGEIYEAAWADEMNDWRQAGPDTLHRRALRILCRTGLQWAGLPIERAAVGARTAELAAMIDGAGSLGPRLWRAIPLRLRAERWAQREIARARAERNPHANPTVPRAIAEFREAEGAIMDNHTAAIELLNLLRPIAAIANYVVFTAHALHTAPEWRDRLLSQPSAALAFAQEVRRKYPFFPFIGGRALLPFRWRDDDFPPGSWVILDLYGTNHDRRLWTRPSRFDPHRFEKDASKEFALVPQGAGDAAADHRCPGEAITVDVMRRSALLLAGLKYEAPVQSLDIDLGRMPALPESRFVMRPL